MFTLASVLRSDAQVNSEGFRINGSAQQIDQRCYQLTPEENDQAGSMWNTQQIDLRQSFQILVHAYLGCLDEDGADGITFALQPVSTTLGEIGEGIGLQDISPSLGIEFDTYQNFNLNDPEYDHIAMSRDGNLNHVSPTHLAGPVMALPGVTNIEDCDTHSIKIIWDADILMMSVFFDCELRLTYQGDIVSDIFNNDPNVFWGFTSATGGFNNNHIVCFVYSTFLNDLDSEFLCLGDTLSIDLPPAGLNYEWTPDFQISSPTSSSVQIYPTNDTNYILTISDECNASLTDSLHIEVRDVQIDSFQILDIDCIDNLVDIRLIETNGFPAYEYQVDGSIFSDSPFFDSLHFGEHTFVVRDSLNCLDTLMTLINDIPRPQINEIDIQEPSCFDDGRIQIFATGGTGDLNYALEYPEFGSLLQFDNLSPGLYQVWVVDDNGCETRSDSFALIRDTILIDDIELTEASCNEEGGMLQILASGGIGNKTYSLDNIQFQESPVFMLPSGSYSVWIQDERGCIVRSPELIISSECIVYVPNVFSPNNDGINDQWSVLGNQEIVQQIEVLQIFDRSGGLVFEHFNFPINSSTDGWDGNSNSGQPYTSQVFTYFLEYSLRNGEIEHQFGTITLIK